MHLRQLASRWISYPVYFGSTAGRQRTASHVREAAGDVEAVYLPHVGVEEAVVLEVALVPLARVARVVEGGNLSEEMRNKL